MDIICKQVTLHAQLKIVGITLLALVVFKTGDTSLFNLDRNMYYNPKMEGHGRRGRPRLPFHDQIDYAVVEGEVKSLQNR